MSVDVASLLCDAGQLVRHAWVCGWARGVWHLAVHVRTEIAVRTSQDDDDDERNFTEIQVGPNTSRLTLAQC